MKQIVFSIVLGTLSFFPFFLGAELFEVHGRTSFREVAAGCIAMAAYLAVCQFLVVRHGAGGEAGESIGGWASPVAMVAPVIVMFLFIVAVEAPEVVVAQGIPMVAASCAGSLAGALLARRKAVPARAYAANSGRLARRTFLVAGAILLLAVAAVLLLTVVPAVAKDVSNCAAPRRAVNGLAVCAALQSLLAVLMLWKTRAGKAPAAAGVVSPILGLLYLAMASDFLAHDAAMRGTAMALFACGGMDFAACALAVAAILRSTDPAGPAAAPAH